MPDTSSQLLRAANFAARRHAGQKRKGAAQEPYINHLLEVAGLLAECIEGVEGQEGDINLLMAALLHDTIEDVEVKREEIEAEFGADVASLVLEVTDDKSLKKEKRKELQVEHAPHKSPRAKMLKIADKTSNLRALVSSPPPDWDHARKAEYFDWAARVVAGCRGVNSRLDAMFDEAHRAGTEALARE